MYYSHFGLGQPPFKITPNTEFFFSGGNRGPILEALVYAISQGEGIIKVTGEVGSGKTMLCNMLQARLPANVENVYIANPSVSPEDILRAIAFELGLKLPHEARHLEVMQSLHNYLLERHAQGKQVVVFVEESQNMPLATLEEIRLLSNLETHHHKLLQIVLFGQPELDDNLRNSQIRQLRERITHSFRLAPLNPRDIREYLNFRLRVAGYRGPDLFSNAVVNYIAKTSEGLSRRVNLIADKTLLAAFAENTHTLRLKHAKAAVRDSEFSHYESRRLAPRWAFALAALGSVALAGIGIVVSGMLRRDAPPATDAAPVAEAESLLPEPTDKHAVSTKSVDTASATSAPARITQTPTSDRTIITPPRNSTVSPKTDDKKSSNQEVNKPSKNVSANSQWRNGDDSLAAGRLAATQEWLAQQKGGTYTVQLMGTENLQQLMQHLSIFREFIEINDIFVYRTMAQGKPSLTVLYGSFGDRRAAQEALDNLPPQLKAYKPYLRTVQGVRAEIASHSPS